MEEGEADINFLYIPISIKDRRHDFAIYRKATCSDMAIHGSYFCPPPAHKYAAYHQYMDQFMSIPLSKTNFNNREAEVIKYRVRTTSLPGGEPSDRRKWLSMPFLAPLFKIINKHIRILGIRPAFFSLLNLRKLLCPQDVQKWILSRSLRPPGCHLHR